MLCMQYHSIDQVTDQALTPMMRQYKCIKAEYIDCLVLFRCGDFFETFFQDAIDMSHTLGLVLTSKMLTIEGDRCPLSGIPFHALDRYAGILLLSGYTVAICEEVGSRVEGKLTPRLVTQVYIPN